MNRIEGSETGKDATTPYSFYLCSKCGCLCNEWDWPNCRMCRKLDGRNEEDRGLLLHTFDKFDGFQVVTPT